MKISRSCSLAERLRGKYGGGLSDGEDILVKESDKNRLSNNVVFKDHSAKSTITNSEASSASNTSFVGVSDFGIESDGEHGSWRSAQAKEVVA